MVRLLLCVQVVDGADLLSERTETEDKKLNKVCLLLFSSAPQFKASICSPIQATSAVTVARASCQGQLVGTRCVAALQACSWLCGHWLVPMQQSA